MNSSDVREVPVRGDARRAYQAALSALGRAGVPFLVGGGFAMHQYLGRWRSTKDLDLFIRSRDVKRSLEALAGTGFRVELTDPSWLAKAFRDGVLVDLIFSSYNGLFPVDDHWFENASEGEVLLEKVQLAGPEEMIVSKAFVAARDRFDGSDVSWLIKTLGPRIDWQRVERMMAEHWEVLLWQLVHFRYVFPEDRDKVPDSVVARLLQRMESELRSKNNAPAACRGPMLDPIHYLAAVLEHSEDLEKGEVASRELQSEPVATH